MLRVPRKEGLNAIAKMKLRLRDNSMRLRLTRGEIASLHNDGACESITTLGPASDQRLVYRVESTAAHDSDVISRIHGGKTTITASIPLADAIALGATDQVGVYFDTAWGLSVAIEKDFRCLDGNREEAESDHYDNPDAATSRHTACLSDRAASQLRRT